MTMLPYMQCSVCGCDEVVAEQVGDEAMETCLECGMLIHTFVEKPKEGGRLFSDSVELLKVLNLGKNFYYDD